MADRKITLIDLLAQCLAGACNIARLVVLITGAHTRRGR